MNEVWKSDLQKQLISKIGAKKGAELFDKYSNAFPNSYADECTPDQAIIDISNIEKLSSQNLLDIYFYLTSDNALHLRLYQYDNPIPLSDILPMLENMGLRTFSERPYKIKLETSSIWISDFVVTYANLASIKLDAITTIFQDAFIKIRLGLVENDGLNKLVLAAQLSAKEISILRFYTKYLRQTGFRFSQAYIEQTIINNPSISKNLVDLFKNKFDPDLQSKSSLTQEYLETTILQDLEAVVSLDEDKTLRCFLSLIKATLRTNYFQTQANGEDKEYLSCKLESSLVPELPLPLPLYEIFVYSARFEGIHLRSAKVARGGIRWSDRREDFRTEILGLMKAQKVKNAVIVPSGAKGGFVLKALPPQAARDVIQTEVIICYKFFICGLLDLTDNLIKNKVIKPDNVVCYDGDDTYLVVAADKGTATFSDIANGLSDDYNFWLGDAFASGGSAGYDHKKMGITARGAWESIKRHFHDLNHNIQEMEFTVVGIGDMSGDVFGNGMLYTPNINLVAAFDHRHIFLDPNPNGTLSYKERARLFSLPTSSWEDYDPNLISKGGGVYKRSLKSIALTPEVQAVLGINETSLTPNDLIRAILKAPVQLLFNGGIGTYVKASTETHADVGDKTNEYCRINGNELRCKIVGEGGNLGFTQLARIEFALLGGLINTDFIDNSGGVDCSDHEVNIKILLNPEVAKQKITEAQRNELLAGMTDEVTKLVLEDNYNQALVLSVAHFYSPHFIGLQTNYIRDLESAGVLNRSVEFLPDEKKLTERKAAGLGLTRPELAVLMAYTKINLKKEILNSDIPDQPFLSQILDTAFPASLRKNYAAAMAKHSLHREIIATQLSNFIVNEMGVTFVYNLQIDTGAATPDILRAYIVASRVFQGVELQKIIDSLEFRLPIATQYDLLGYVRRLIYLSTRWFIRNTNLTDANMPDVIEHYSKSVKSLEELIPSLMGGFTKNYLDTLTAQFTEAGISSVLAYRIGSTRAIYTSLNVIQVATQHKLDLEKTAKIYFAVGEKFNLLWFRDRIANDAREGYWESVARLTLRDELDVLQKQLSVTIMKHNKIVDPQESIVAWTSTHQRPMERWEKVLGMLHSSTSVDYVMFFIALRELYDLIHTAKTLP